MTFTLLSLYSHSQPPHLHPCCLFLPPLFCCLLVSCLNFLYVSFLISVLLASFSSSPLSHPYFLSPVSLFLPSLLFLPFSSFSSSPASMFFLVTKFPSPLTLASLSPLPLSPQLFHSSLISSFRCAPCVSLIPASMFPPPLSMRLHEGETCSTQTDSSHTSGVNVCVLMKCEIHSSLIELDTHSFIQPDEIFSNRCEQMCVHVCVNSVFESAASSLHISNVILTSVDESLTRTEVPCRLFLTSV